MVNPLHELHCAQMLSSNYKEKLNRLTRTDHVLDVLVVRNFNRQWLKTLVLPLVILFAIVVFLGMENALSIEGYVHIQKDLFIYLNGKLSAFPTLQLNLTQLGDVLILLPFFALLMIHAPKFWEALLTALVVSFIITTVLKNLFAVPRPAAMFAHDSFVIIGRTLSGSNSLPSGHSISTFTILSTLFFAFMPKKAYLKVLWSILIFLPALVIVLSRVGVGAHYPLDVTIGSVLGYISAILGIYACKRFNIMSWITDRRYYLFSVILFGAGLISIVNDILITNLAVYFFSLLFLLIAFFIITYIYVKKQH